MTLHWLTTVKTYGGKRSSKWWMAMLQTQILSQRKINDCYSFATIPLDRSLCFQMIIYRFQVIHQTSRDPSVAIFMTEPYGVSSPLYIESKWNLHWWQAKHLTLWRNKVSLINRSTIRTQRLTNQHFFPFKTNGRTCDFECPMYGIINSDQIEGAYFGRVLSIFLPKKLHNDFFWK